MSKYIKLFENHAQYETFIGGGGDTPFVRPNVSHCIAENEVHYNPTWAEEYLTFVALEDGTFTFTPANNNAISYSIDNGHTWTDLAADTNTPTVTRGKKVLWRGKMTPISSDGVGKFNSTGRFEAQGNVMSLLFGADFKGKTDLTGKNFAFYRLFSSNSKLVNAQNLSLPAITLASWCYGFMFYGCTNLVNAPVLSATTLAGSCYGYMFYGCTSLTTAPELPATTLASYCYQYMFQGCTSLETAPTLPAETLASDCYQYMFDGCTSLITAPSVLPAKALTTNCYSYMFQGCTSLTTAPELPATTLALNCYYAMFNGCESLTTAPSVLPAKALTTNCYSNMFESCTSLETAPELPAETLVDYCYFSMFYGCSSLNYIKCLATDISATECLRNWVIGVASSGTFVKAASMTSWTTGTSGIPSKWTVQDATE